MDSGLPAWLEPLSAEEKHTPAWLRAVRPDTEGNLGAQAVHAPFRELPVTTERNSLVAETTWSWERLPSSTPSCLACNPNLAHRRACATSFPT